MRKWFMVFLGLVWCAQSWAESTAPSLVLALNWKPEPQFGGFYAAHGILQRGAHVERRLTDVFPMAAGGNLKAMLISEVLAVGFHHLDMLFIPYITDTLEE